MAKITDYESWKALDKQRKLENYNDCAESNKSYTQVASPSTKLN